MRSSWHARATRPQRSARVWRLMTGLWPAYDEYQAKTERQIPVVVLEPVRD
jgi:F420H(2)-dependent quinone reductase